jgi:hypothetical protein
MTSARRSVGAKRPASTPLAPSMIAYLDNAVLRRELARGQDARLAEGRFGRP